MFLSSADIVAIIAVRQLPPIHVHEKKNMLNSRATVRQICAARVYTKEKRVSNYTIPAYKHSVCSTKYIQRRVCMFRTTQYFVAITVQ